MSATRSESFNFSHVTIGGGGCLFRTAAVLTRVQVRHVPIPPMMLAVGLLVLAVVFLRLAQDLGESCDFHGSCSRRLPFAAGKTRCDLLKQPAVPIWILERGKREVGTALRVAPADARILHGVVEAAAGVMSTNNGVVRDIDVGFFLVSIQSLRRVEVLEANIQKRRFSIESGIDWGAFVPDPRFLPVTCWRRRRYFGWICPAWR